MTPELTQLKLRLKSTWMTGDYERFARFMEPGAQEFYGRLNLPRGVRLLDVGCGAGQLAIIAARAGAEATGCDIAPNWLERARARVAAEGLTVYFDEADAESLPYADGQFDAVASLVGAMFAPRPALVAAELTRVCAPGGVIAMANWTPAGFIGQMFRIIARHIAPNGMPSPVLWGDPAVVAERLKTRIASLRCHTRQYRFAYPFPPAAVVEFFRAHYGPMTRAFEGLSPVGQRELHQDLTTLWSTYNQASGDSTQVDAEYLEVIALKERP